MIHFNTSFLDNLKLLTLAEHNRILTSIMNLFGSFRHICLQAVIGPGKQSDSSEPKDVVLMGMKTS